MYNGIGLQTPRGSGTSGHVQSNKFLANPRPSSFSEAGGCGIPNPAPTGIDGTRKPNKDILEHDRKRQVELRLLVLGDELEEQGYTEAEIEERIEEERKAAEIEAAAEEEEGRPCAQSKGTGLIPPVDNFGEQADPSAADVEEVEDIVRSKKKGGSRIKLGNFAPEEDVIVVKSRLEMSWDPIINTLQKKENFWQRITKRYNENRGQYPERTLRSIQSRWERIKQESEKIAGFLAENASGKSDADKTSEAAATYAGVEGHNFQFMHCWVLLKDEPKWRDMIQKGGQHAAADRSGDHIPQGLNTINLDDDDPAAAASRKRPMGRDTAKASQMKNCSSVSTSSSEHASKMQEISLQKMSIWQDENCKGDHLDQLATIEEKRYDELREHNKSILQLEHEKIRIMRDKLDMQMREKEREREEREKKEDERILKIDLDSCTPELRAYYQALREEIMEKLAARRMRNQRS